MLKIEISKRAAKFLKELHGKQARQVGTKIQELRNNPSPNDSIKLKGHPYRRTDIGEYRIVYYVETDILKIHVVGKRNDDEVYKILRRE